MSAPHNKPTSRRIPRPDVTVACGGCRVCCTNTNVALFDGDDLALYERKFLLAGINAETDAFYRTYDNAYTGYVLERDANDTCAYMSDTGCSIYDARPIACRSFSCVNVVARILAMPADQQAARYDITRSQIYREGLARTRVRDSADEDCP